MKTVAALFLMGTLLFGLAGCAREVEKRAPEKNLVVSAQESEVVINIPEVGSFSYEKVRAQFGEGTPGVKTDGFRNVVQCAVMNEEDAAERAKAECTVEYDFVRVRYDSTADIWEVCFLANHPGGGQDVYLNSKGLTQFIVYGE